jgi:16S rRNA (guanine527-N7)-methyltransferase
MHPARIAELLEPFLGSANGQRLTANDLNRISTYIDILSRWNARINLTAVREPEEIVQRHFGESLFAASHLVKLVSSASQVCSSFESPSSSSSATSVVNSPLSVADIGSGAGFPGLPIKLWAPQIALTLVESNHKKATFLREVVRSLALANVNIKNVRAESLTETFGLVTLRAVEDFASVLPAAAALVAPEGRLGLLIGSSQIETAHALLPHFSWSEAVPIPQARSRIVLAGSRLG